MLAPCAGYSLPLCLSERQWAEFLKQTAIPEDHQRNVAKVLGLLGEPSYACAWPDFVWHEAYVRASESQVLVQWLDIARRALDTILLPTGVIPEDVASLVLFSPDCAWTPCKHVADDRFSFVNDNTLTKVLAALSGTGPFDLDLSGNGLSDLEPLVRFDRPLRYLNLSYNRLFYPECEELLFKLLRKVDPCGGAVIVFGNQVAGVSAEPLLATLVSSALPQFMRLLWVPPAWVESHGWRTMLPLSPADCKRLERHYTQRYQSLRIGQ